jgi:hypothetical protein
MTRDLVVGFVAGVVAGAAGLYYYKKNRQAIHSFLAGQGLSIGGGDKETDQDLESIVAEKERLEDLIAEREAAAG